MHAIGACAIGVYDHVSLLGDYEPFVSKAYNRPRCITNGRNIQSLVCNVCNRCITKERL